MRKKCGMRTFETKRAARASARTRVASGKIKGQWMVFHCAKCGFWHNKELTFDPDKPRRPSRNIIAKIDKALARDEKLRSIRHES